MSEVLEVGVAADMPAVQFRSAGVVYDPSPAPVATVVAPDGTTTTPSLTKQGSGSTARFLLVGFTKSTPGLYEIRYTTTDTAADVRAYVDYARVEVPGASGDAPSVAEIVAGMDSDSVMLARIAAKTDLLTPGIEITVASPLDPGDLSLLLVRDDDYTVGSGRTLPTWEAAAWVTYDLLSATGITLRLRDKYRTVVLEVTAAATSATTVQVELTATDTHLAVGYLKYDYALVAVLAGGDTVTLAIGGVTVVDALTPA